MRILTGRILRGRKAPGAALAVLIAATLAGCGTDTADQSGRAEAETGSPATTGTGVDVPHLDEITVERIEYPTHDDADTEQNWADFYLPAGDQKVDSIPLVVLIHGGSWQSQLGANLFDPLARDLAGRGMAVYNIEYRRVGSGGGWPTTFHDVALALDHVVEIDKKYPQITTDDELVVGHSAGAQLAVWGGTRHKLNDDEVGSQPAFRPTRVVSLAGPLDMVYAATHGDDRIVTALGGPPHRVPDRYALVDPIQNIDPDTPVVAVHGTRDTMVAPVNSERYAQKATSIGGQARAVLINGEDHGSLVSSNSPSYERILSIITDASSSDLGDVTQP